jgi:hypothetical protein
MHELGSQTSRTHSFVGWNSSMSRTDAFRGFLGLFKGDYTAAYQDLEQCLADAYKAAFELEDAIADARRDILRADAGVSTHHKAIEVRTEQVTPDHVPGMSVPGLTDDVRGPAAVGSTAHAGLNSPEVDEAIRHSGDNPPRHASPHSPTKSPFAPVDAVHAGVSVVHHAGENDDALDDKDKMKDYLDRKGGKR